MNRKQSLPSAVALCCALATATPSTGQQRVPEKLRIGTWNLEHFGHRTVYGTNELNPRTADDIAKIADYIRQLEVDVLAVQEIADPAALRQLCELIGDDWDCVVGTTGGFSGGNGRISPGFLWNGATVELLQAEDLMQLPRNRDGVSIFHRVPVSAVFRARPDGLDFRAVTVHFKAGRGTKNERKRSAETATLLEWIHALQSRSDEDQDVVVLGDFNHTYGAPAHASFTTGGGIRYLRSEGDPPTIVHFPEPIDHVAVTAGISAELVTGSRKAHGDPAAADKKAWQQTYSDHIPVTVELLAAVDRDPDAGFEPAPASQRLRPMRATPVVEHPAPADTAFPVGCSVRVYFVRDARIEMVRGQLAAPLGDWIVLRTENGDANAFPREQVSRIERGEE